MSAPSLASQAAKANGYPSVDFNKREQQLLASVKAYVDGQSGPGAVTLSQLAPGIAPGWIIKSAGSFTTVGGSASQSITVSGALSSDIALCIVKTQGVSPQTVARAAAASNAISVTMSADPGSDTVLSWVLLRAAS